MYLFMVLYIYINLLYIYIINTLPCCLFSKKRSLILQYLDQHDPASRATIENCLPRYELAAKQIIWTFWSWPAFSHSLTQEKCSNARWSPRKLCRFLSFRKLTTSDASYHSLYKWLGRSNSPIKLTIYKFKLSKRFKKIYEKNSGMKVDISQISLTSSSTTARKGKTFKKKLDNDIHSYYEYVTTKDKFSSQTNISLDRTNLFKIDTSITITTHAELISKDLNSKINILVKQCIPSCFDILNNVGFENLIPIIASRVKYVSNTPYFIY